MHEEISLEQYKAAVWDFMLEHSDVTDGGAFFIKFHASGKADLEKRIWARAVYDYHRVDTRTGETHEQKEMRAQTQREGHKVSKRMKREKWKAGKEERARALREVKRKNEWRARYGKLFPVMDYIHRLYTTLTRKR